VLVANHCNKTYFITYLEFQMGPTKVSTNFQPE